jgi:hypothetical protein
MISVLPAPLYDYRVTRSELDEGGISPDEWTSFIDRFPELVCDPVDRLVGRWNGFSFHFENGLIRGDDQHELVMEEARRIATGLRAKCVARCRPIGGEAGPWEEQEPLDSRLGDTLVRDGYVHAAFHCALCGGSVVEVRLTWNEGDAAREAEVSVWTPASERVVALPLAEVEDVRSRLIRLDAGRALADRDPTWVAGFCRGCNAFLCVAHWDGDTASARCSLRGHPGHRPEPPGPEPGDPPIPDIKVP